MAQAITKKKKKSVGFGASKLVYLCRVPIVKSGPMGQRVLLNNK